MGNTRRRFGAEFKREAVRQAMQPGNAVATVAQDLSVLESKRSGPRDGLDRIAQSHIQVCINRRAPTYEVFVAPALGTMVMFCIGFLRSTIPAASMM